MAIKVKHEGNVTSRIVASSLGGQAKRNAEDSKALAQMAAQQNMAANRQLQGAHASPVAPGHATAQLGHASAPALSAPRPPADPERMAEALRRTGEVQNDLVAERELTAQGRRERAALVNDVVDAIKQGRFSREEMPKLLERFGDAEDTIRMADALREREPTAEEAFRKSTFTDQNGVVFGRDGKMLYNPNDARMKQAEYEAKLLDALKARADKFELELRKPYKVTVGEGDDAIEQTQMRDDAEVERLMKRRFPELYAQPVTQPTTMPIDEARKLLDPFAQYGGYMSLIKQPIQPATPTDAPAASATRPAAPVVGDPASFDQFKKRK